MSADPFEARRDTYLRLQDLRRGRWKMAEACADSLARQVADTLLASGRRRPAGVAKLRELLAQYDAAAQAERTAWGEFQAHCEIGVLL